MQMTSRALALLACLGLLLAGRLDAQPLSVDQPFITTWRTTAANESITIPTPSWQGGYNYAVDWGDGNTSVGQTGNATHIYAVAGDYSVKIIGDFPRIDFFGASDILKIRSIDQWGDIAWTSMEEAFEGCANLGYTATDNPVFSPFGGLTRVVIDNRNKVRQRASETYGQKVPYRCYETSVVCGGDAGCGTFRHECPYGPDNQKADESFLLAAIPRACKQMYKSSLADYLKLIGVSEGI